MRRGQRVSEALVAQMREAVASGESRSSVARRLGVHRDTVSRHCPPPRRHPMDRNKPENRIQVTPRFLSRLLDMLEEGLNKAEVARTIGYSERHTARLIDKARAQRGCVGGHGPAAGVAT